MADVRIYSSELAVGYNHSSLTDVINRPWLVAHDASGHHSSVDFPILHIHGNGTNQAGGTGNDILVFSTAGGVVINRGPFVLASTGFSPPSTGKYWINSVCKVNLGVSAAIFSLGINRNTSLINEGMLSKSQTSGVYGCHVFALVNCESTTDVFAIRLYTDLSTHTISGTAIETYTQAWKAGP